MRSDFCLEIQADCLANGKRSWRVLFQTAVTAPFSVQSTCNFYVRHGKVGPRCTLLVAKSNDSASSEINTTTMFPLGHRKVDFTRSSMPQKQWNKARPPLAWEAKTTRFFSVLRLETFKKQVAGTKGHWHDAAAFFRRTCFLPKETHQDRWAYGYRHCRPDVWRTCA